MRGESIFNRLFRFFISYIKITTLMISVPLLYSNKVALNKEVLVLCNQLS